jgi:uncharacterized membrane protein
MRRAVEFILCLAVSAALGTMLATSFTCGVGKLNGTDTWCGVGYFWIVGIPIAVVVAFVAAWPLLLIFRRLKLRKSWHYAAAGVLAAAPVWLALAQPFSSVRWLQAGLYDTLNYLGTGLAAALVYWFLAKRTLGTGAA